ncbi:hypothetical protein BASA50_002845 [Batrachochytrium salamandrivorans]|uniref:RNA polymerase II assembly factor Rtp1 C-terminal domain-containing protein n=1 Tax=Batrachochytrium salamandrivorans TaxID=1357716 RepID=A0ABQ8FK29_9FUNG|nr:hypothetical protein BASA50_002845 [Batrachochytrium salamandrivorans]
MDLLGIVSSNRGSGSQTQQQQLKMTWGEALVQLLCFRPAQLAYDASTGRSDSVIQARLPTPISRAINLVASHVASSPSEGSGFVNVYRLIEEKILLTEPADSRTSACMVLSALLRHPISLTHVTDGLVNWMETGTRSSKLSVALFLEYILLNRASGTTAKSVSNNTNTSSDNQAGLPEKTSPEDNLLRRLIPYLIKCIDLDGIHDDVAKTYQQTRLTMLASTLILAYFYSETLQDTTQQSRPILGNVVQICDEPTIHTIAPQFAFYIKSIHKYDSGNPLRAPFLRLLETIIQEGIDQFPKTHESMAVLIAAASKAMASRESLNQQKILKRLKNIFEKESDMMLQTIRLCATLSSLSRQHMDELVLNGEFQQPLLDLISETIHQDQSDPLRQLSFHLLRRVLVVVDPDALGTILDPLVDMLRSDSLGGNADSNNMSLSHCIAGVVAEYAAIHPHQTLRGVFHLLASDSLTARRNGMYVLQQVIEINRSLIETDPHFEMSCFIGKHFLSCLTDSDLGLRKQAVFIFSHMDPALVIPVLAQQLTARDERGRSAAELALVELFQRNNYKLGALEMFIEYIRVISDGKHYDWPPKIDSPAQIGLSLCATPSGINAQEINKSVDRMIRVMAKYAEGMDSEACMFLLPMLVRKLYGCTSDPLLVRLLSTFSPAYITSPLACIQVVQFCIDIMRTQPRLTEDLLTSTYPHAVESVLFARLCPLLILKMIPLEALDALPRALTAPPPKDYYHLDSLSQATMSDEPNSHMAADDEIELDTAQSRADSMLIINLADQLIVRIEHPLEFEEVQKLACQVLSQLPLWYLSKSLLMTKFDKMVALSNLRCVRLYIFIACHCVISRSVSDMIHSGLLNDLVSRIFLTVLWEPELSSHNDSEAKAEEALLAKIQSGSVELLSLMLCTEAKYNVSMTLQQQQQRLKASPLIVEISSSAPSSSETPEQQDHAASIESASHGVSENILDIVCTCLNPLAVYPPFLFQQHGDVIFGGTEQEDQLTRCRLATCLANAIHFAIKLLCTTTDATHSTLQSSSPSPTALASTQLPHVVSSQNIAAAAWLSQRLLSHLLETSAVLLRWNGRHDADSFLPRGKVVVMAILQAVFQLVYHGSSKDKSQGYVVASDSVLDFLLEFMAYADRFVQLGCLKIVGAILGGLERNKVDPRRVVRLRHALKGHVDMGDDPECRTLAKQLYGLIE